MAMFLIGSTLFAGTGAHADMGKLVVATREVPLFVIRQENGSLSGIAIDLWRDIASDLGLVYELKETDLSGMFVGVIIWLFERRANPDQLGGKSHQGIGSGFCWSAVTMTTLCYGHRTPVTPMGRLPTIIWIFFSVITISELTAAIASVFTVQ